MATKQRVLVVDDDPTILRMMGMIFHQAGYEVHVAKDGIEALSKVGEVEPGLVILDVMMPKMSGLEVCQRLRDNPATAQLPIIFTSAKGQVSDRVVGLQAGADDYMKKPVDARELLARVNVLLQRVGYAQTPTARIVAVVSTKGGVGVTSLAVNIAGALASQGQSVALVEMHPHHSTAGHSLNLTPSQDLGKLLTMEPAQLDRPKVTKHLTRHTTGMRLLAAPQDAADHSMTAAHVEAILGALSLEAQYLILDLPAVSGEATRQALERADQILVVTEPEPLSVASARTDLATLKVWGIFDRVSLVIVSRSRSAVMINRAEIENQLSVRVVGFIPPAPEAFQDAVRMGMPVVLAKSDTLVANALMELVKWLTEQATVAA